MSEKQFFLKYGFVLILTFCLISGFQWNVQSKETERLSFSDNHQLFLLSTNNKQTNTVNKVEIHGDGNIEKWAVIIVAGGGVGYGAHERADRNDVRKLTKVLLNTGWDEDHILFLLEEQATYEAIMNDSFSWLRLQGEDEDDLVLYLFSGHGYYHTTDEPPLDEPDGRDEIIHPWDPDMAGWNPDLFILDDQFKDKFDLLHSKNLVIVICTCHAGGFIDGSYDLAESGRVVLVSCDVDESSWRTTIPYDWIFPYYFIKGLQGYADKNNDDLISAEELFEYTVEPVQIRANLLSYFKRTIPLGSSSQHPQMYDGWPSDKDNTDELILVDLGSS